MQREREAQYWRWYETLSTQQRLVEDQRRHEKDVAATQALGMVMMNGGLFRHQPVPSYTTPAYQSHICTTQTTTRGMVYTICQ